LITSIRITSIRNTETAGIRERSRLQKKNPDKRRWPILKSVALSTKIFYITNISCRFFIWQPSHLRLQEGACREQSAWREKRKYASFLWLCIFPLQFVLLHLLQDHSDGDVEASGIALICSFHQTVPGGLQVVVPIRNIWKRGTGSRWT
jgi:hypothetical protein